MLRRLLLCSFATLACLSGPVTPSAEACPMCKTANEQDDNRPKAYMYSILFMLAMPGAIFTGFGVSFYRLSRKQQLELDGDLAATDDSQATDAATDVDAT